MESHPSSDTYLGGVDDLVGESLGDGLERAESRLAGALADEVNGLVDSAERRHIHGLSTHDTTRSDTGGVLAAAASGDGSDEDLDGVLAGEEVNQLEGLLGNSDSQLLFTVVPVAGNHDHAGKTLDDGARGLLESTLLVATGGVGDKDLLAGGLDLEVVGQGVVGALHTLVRPLAEHLRFHGEFGPVVFDTEHRGIVCSERDG